MSRYLDMVDGPEHVKKLTLPQLQELAAEIQQDLISVLARNGGHLGPNLGVLKTRWSASVNSTTPRLGPRCPPLRASTEIRSCRISAASSCSCGSVSFFTCSGP